MKRDAFQYRVGASLYWIWFVGAAAWFLDAVFSMHHHALRRGLLATAVSAMFLIAGMFYRRQANQDGKQ